MLDRAHWPCPFHPALRLTRRARRFWLTSERSKSTRLSVVLPIKVYISLFLPLLYTSSSSSSPLQLVPWYKNRVFENAASKIRSLAFDTRDCGLFVSAQLGSTAPSLFSILYTNYLHIIQTMKVKKKKYIFIQRWLTCIILHHRSHRLSQVKEKHTHPNKI